MKKLLLVSILCACAHAQSGSGAPETEVQVLDPAGEPLLGSVNFWSRAAKDDCAIYGASCTVSVPLGDYTLIFHKERSGRVGGSVGGQVQEAKRGGCLKARVHVIPGQKILCKQTGEFSCGQGAYGNLDCGQSDAARYGFKPGPADEPPAPAQ